MFAVSFLKNGIGAISAAYVIVAYLWVYSTKIDSQYGVPIAYLLEIHWRGICEVCHEVCKMCVYSVFFLLLPNHIIM